MGFFLFHFMLEMSSFFSLVSCGAASWENKEKHVKH